MEVYGRCGANPYYSFSQVCLLWRHSQGKRVLKSTIHRPIPPPGYYSAGPPVIVGDYDDHHVWHDRDWWVGHNRDWVSTHHHEWLEHHDEHEHKGG